MSLVLVPSSQSRSLVLMWKWGCCWAEAGAQPSTPLAEPLCQQICLISYVERLCLQFWGAVLLLEEQRELWLLHEAQTGASTASFFPGIWVSSGINSYGPCCVGKLCPEQGSVKSEGCFPLSLPLL